MILDSYTVTKTATMTAGTNTVETDPVPSGNPRNVTQTNFIYTGTITSVTVALYIVNNGVATLWRFLSAVISGGNNPLTVNLYLFPGDFLRVVITNATAGNTATLSGCGTEFAP